jgi:hypothetical protein
LTTHPAAPVAPRALGGSLALVAAAQQKVHAHGTFSPFPRNSRYSAAHACDFRRNWARMGRVIPSSPKQPVRGPHGQM